MMIVMARALTHPGAKIVEADAARQVLNAKLKNPTGNTMRPTRCGRMLFSAQGGPLMKKLSLLGIIVGGVVLALTPVSVQWTPKKLGLYADKAEAQYYRRQYRRAYRRAYRRSYYS